MRVSRAWVMPLVSAAIACTRAPHSAPVDPLDIHGRGAAQPRAPDRMALSPSSTIQLGRSTFTFGLAMHQALARDRAWAGRNVVISPCSLSAAFGMIYAGAKGQTAREIAGTLHYGLDEPELGAAWATLRGELTELDATPKASAKSSRAPVDFLMANSLWAQAGVTLAPAYQAAVAEHYAGALETVDFARGPEQARGRINGWVKERTRGLVAELFPSGSFAGSTSLVVVNTAYLRGVWEQPFARSETRPESFEKLDGQRAQIPTMHGALDAGYIETSDYQATQLRYVGDRLSMVVILPARGQFAAVEQRLDAASLAELTEALPQARRQVRVSLPKFAISMPFSLAPTLAELGMKRAFQAGAEFGGMVTGDRASIFLGEVRHHVHLSVDEEQTEAAAATGVVISYGAKVEQATVRVDRPFLLGIHDRKTGMLLFWGRVVDPGAER